MAAADQSLTTAANAAPSLRDLFRKREDPYAGADMRIAQRLAAPVWLINAFVALALLPLAPPTLAVEAAGWLVAALAVLGSCLAALRLSRRGERTSNDELLVMSYLGTAQVAVFQSLTGGNESPFVSLYLLWAIYTAAAHPPRRTAVFMAFVAAAATSSLLYDGWDGLAAADLGVQLVLWSSLALLATVWTNNVRSQRLHLTEEEQEAQRRARIDPLTGLENRRAFDEALGAEARRA